MPRYEYECPKCKRRYELQRKIEERDYVTGCSTCYDDEGNVVLMERVPTMPAGHFPGASSG